MPVLTCGAHVFRRCAAAKLVPMTRLSHQLALAMLGVMALNPLVMGSEIPSECLLDDFTWTVCNGRSWDFIMNYAPFFGCELGVCGTGTTLINNVCELDCASSDRRLEENLLPAPADKTDAQAGSIDYKEHDQELKAEIEALGRAALLENPATKKLMDDFAKTSPEMAWQLFQWPASAF